MAEKTRTSRLRKSLSNNTNDVKNTVFIKKISTNGTLSERASLLANQAEEVINGLLTEKKQDLNVLKMKRQRLLDFAPDSTESLIPKGYNDWDAKSWAMQLHDIDAEILEVLDSIDILESLIEELFTEVNE